VHSICGNCSQVAFKIARAMFSFEVGWGGQQFSVGFRKLLVGVAPARISL
jgi:hypothetical protein